MALDNKLKAEHALRWEQWRINRFVVVIATFLFYLGLTFVMPFLPLYVHQLGVTDIGEAAVWSGILIGVSPLLSGLLSPVWGALADRVGRKLIFERSLLVFSLVFFAMSLVTNVYQLMALRILWGLLGGFTAISTAMVSFDGPREQMGKGVGLLQSAQFISYAVGPTVGGFLADNFGLRQSFYLPAGLCTLALIGTHLLYRDVQGPKGVEEKPSTNPEPVWRTMLTIPQFLPLVAVLFLAQFVDKSFGVTIPLLVATLEGNTAGVATLSGIIVSSGAVAAAVSAWLVGRSSTRRSPRQLLMATLLCGLLVSVPMTLASTTWELLAFRALLGLLAGGTITLAYTVGGLALPGGARTAAIGLLAGAALMGSAASPVVSGFLIGVNIHASFAVNALAYGLALIALAIAAKRIAHRARADTRTSVSSGE